MLVQTETGPGALGSPTANVPDVSGGAFGGQTSLAPPVVNEPKPRKIRVRDPRCSLRRAASRSRSRLTLGLLAQGELRDLSNRNIKRRLVPRERDDTTYHAPAQSHAAMAAPLGPASGELNDGVVEVDHDRIETAALVETDEAMAERVRASRRSLSRASERAVG